MKAEQDDKKYDQPTSVVDAPTTPLLQALPTSRFVSFKGPTLGLPPAVIHSMRRPWLLLMLMMRYSHQILVLTVLARWKLLLAAASCLLISSAQSHLYCA